MLPNGQTSLQLTRSFKYYVSNMYTRQKLSVFV